MWGVSDNFIAQVTYVLISYRLENERLAALEWGCFRDPRLENVLFVFSSLCYHHHTGCEFSKYKITDTVLLRNFIKSAINVPTYSIVWMQGLFPHAKDKYKSYTSS
jgi:hypothetical protein